MEIDIKSAILNEQSILRTELQELKRCQLQYFLFSLGAAGAVLGFNIKIQDCPENNIFFLAPLLVILPCWRTFFDKATTITRLTGYIRVFIEDQFKNDKYSYYGYENALAEFRLQEEKAEPNKPSSNKASAKIQVKTRHLYWRINWNTFFFLSFICCILPLFHLKEFDYHNYWPLILFYSLFVIAVIRTTYKTLIILKALKSGKFSYENVKDYWELNVLPHLEKRTSLGD